MNPEDKSKIEDLKRSLYSKNVPDIRTKRHLRIDKQMSDIKTDWEHNEENSDNIELTKKYKDLSMSFFKKLLTFSIVVFFLALGAGLYILFNGSNIISADNIEINMNGPISIAGGEPISFDIEITNKNNIKLETVDLSIDFPSGTVYSDNTLKELKSFREIIPDIEPNTTGKKNIEAVIYGRENSKKEINVTIEYRVKGSNSVFKKEKSFDLLINSSPITFSISSIKEVEANQEFNIELTILSNSKEVIKGVLLKAVYPFGFSYISSDIKPFADNALWKIGDIPSSGKKVINIKGKMEGQNDETRIFRFSLGSKSESNDKTIGTEYTTNTQEISIKKPAIAIDVSMEGDSEILEYIGKFSSPIEVEISYFNNLSVPIIDGEIRAKLSGSAFDKASIFPNQGLYVSIDNEIVWNSITTRELKNIPAGGTGTVKFSIIPRDNSNSFKLITNPNIAFSIGMKGKSDFEIDSPDLTVSNINRKIKIASNVSLTGQVLRSVGPFENLGPIPPKAEQTTTYTILWTVDNTSSSVSNAQIVSSLPPYIKWLGKVSPISENISYNSTDGKVVWDIGSVGTYSVDRNTSRQVAFQIALNPSIIQIGQVLDLIRNATLTAQDDFTNQTLNSNLNSLNTRFNTDPLFKSGDEGVVK